MEGSSTDLDSELLLPGAAVLESPELFETRQSPQSTEAHSLTPEGAALLQPLGATEPRRPPMLWDTPEDTSSDIQPVATQQTHQGSQTKIYLAGRCPINAAPLY